MGSRRFSPRAEPPLFAARQAAAGHSACRHAPQAARAADLVPGLAACPPPAARSRRPLRGPPSPGGAAPRRRFSPRAGRRQHGHRAAARRARRGLAGLAGLVVAVVAVVAVVGKISCQTRARGPNDGILSSAGRIIYFPARSRHRRGYKAPKSCPRERRGRLQPLRMGLKGPSACMSHNGGYESNCNTPQLSYQISANKGDFFLTL